jgi:N utilization substance protein B
MKKLNKKTVARIAAIQALYDFEINNNNTSVEKLLNYVYSNYNSEDLNQIFEFDQNIKVTLHSDYLKELVTYTVDNLSYIDKMIDRHLSQGWSKDNLHIALLSLLRVGVGEIVYFEEVSHKIIINEFTNLASEMVKESEIPFVNSILDKIALEIRHV